MTERTDGDFDTKSKQVLREREILGSAPGGEAAPNAERNNDGTDADDTDEQTKEESDQ